MVCELCKLLYNPFKREMLLSVYASRDGVNVSVMADEMSRRGLVVSGVSQYLRQLERLGVIRRERAGRYVNYLPDAKRATEDVRRVVGSFVRRRRTISPAMLDAVFGALMNPFRARIVAVLAKAGSVSALELCEKTEHQLRLLKRDLQPAVYAGLLACDDSDASQAAYRFIPPKDPFVRLLVSVC